jgi:hypothetical protein
VSSAVTRMRSRSPLVGSPSAGGWGSSGECGASGPISRPGGDGGLGVALSNGLPALRLAPANGTTDQGPPAPHPAFPIEYEEEKEEVKNDVRNGDVKKEVRTPEESRSRATEGWFDPHWALRAVDLLHWSLLRWGSAPSR